MYKNRRAAERGAGEIDESQYDKPDEVFGVSGAAALYRLSALRECAINNEYFDTIFFAYKEDVDLAWRLRLYGWTARYCSTAIGYHVRHVAAPAQRTVKALKQNRKDVSKKIRALSLRNQHLMLMKNDSFGLAFRHAPRIIIRELGLLAYTLLFEPYQWKTWLEIFKLMPKMLVARSVIVAHKKVSSKELRKWFV
jgi:GT2 family glycosyltransferase